MKENETLNRVAFLRKRLGLTQTELARKVEVPPQWISKVERNEVKICNISFVNGMRLAQALNINAWELLR